MTRPQAELARVCGFIGVEFDPSMLEYQKTARQYRLPTELASGGSRRWQQRDVALVESRRPPAGAAAATSRASCRRCGWARPGARCCWARPGPAASAAGSRGTARASVFLDVFGRRLGFARASRAAPRKRRQARDRPGGGRGCWPLARTSPRSARSDGDVAALDGLGAYLDRTVAIRSRLSVIARRASGQAPGRVAARPARAAPSAASSCTRSSSPPWSFAIVTTPRPPGSG